MRTEVCVRVLGCPQVSLEVHRCTAPCTPAAPRGPCGLTAGEMPAAERSRAGDPRAGQEPARLLGDPGARGSLAQSRPRSAPFRVPASASWGLLPSQPSWVSRFLYQFLRSGPQGVRLRVPFPAALTNLAAGGRRAGQTLLGTLEKGNRGAGELPGPNLKMLRALCDNSASRHSTPPKLKTPPHPQYRSPPGTTGRSHQQP